MERNEYIFYNSEFHKWIINEWNQKCRPEVLDFCHPGSRMRLWKHECGKYYIKTLNINYIT